MTDGGRPRLFVYGTLRRKGGGPAEVVEALRRHARRVGKATMGGALYDAGPFPVAVAGSEGRVRGEVYELSRPDRVLDLLDRYEGAAAEGERGFRRERVQVELKEGGRREAWAYLYAGDVSHMLLIPDGDWVQHRAEGSG